MKTKKIKKRNIISLILAITIAALIAVSSIAYFTDRVTGTGDIDVGNLKVSISDIEIDTSEVIAPGVIVPLTYTVKNEGSLALDEREKVALAVYKSDGTTPVNLSTTETEFEIYKQSDVELVTGKGYTAKTGASPIGTKTTGGFTGAANGNRLIYQIEQTALNGSDKELGASEPDSVSRDFVVLFRASAGNEFQDVTVKLDVLVEAKQHAYTSAFDPDWSELQTKSATFSTGTQAVVPSSAE